MTPTPRMVRRYRGFAAVSPSLRRSQETCTSIVWSSPQDWCHTSVSRWAAADDLAGPGREAGQQIKLAASERQWAPVEGDTPPGEVDEQAANAQFRGRSGGAPQHRGDPGRESLAGVGLDDVVVCASLQQPGDLGLVVAVRGDDHGGVTDRAHHPQCLRPVQIRQPAVQHDDLRRVAAELADAVQRSGRSSNRMRPLAEVSDRGRAKQRVLFDD